jgi:hypothetical protein
MLRSATRPAVAFSCPAPSVQDCKSLLTKMDELLNEELWPAGSGPYRWLIAGGWEEAGMHRRSPAGAAFAACILSADLCNPA